MGQGGAEEEIAPPYQNLLPFFFLSFFFFPHFLFYINILFVKLHKKKERNNIYYINILLRFNGYNKKIRIEKKKEKKRKKKEEEEEEEEKTKKQKCFI